MSRLSTLSFVVLEQMLAAAANTGGLTKVILSCIIIVVFWTNQKTSAAEIGSKPKKQPYTMAAMSEARKHELAYKVLVDKLRREGVTLDPKNSRRQLGNLAQRIDEPFADVLEIGREIASDFGEEIFAEPGDDY